MPARSAGRKRVPAEDFDSEDEFDTEVQRRTMDEHRIKVQQELMMTDLGSGRMDKIKSDDRKPKPEDRAHVRRLLAIRDVNQEGTEANTLYNKNKTAIAAWSNPANVADNHEEKLDTLDDGNAHRQRMRNLHGGTVEEPDEWEAGYTKAGRGGRARGGGFGARGGRGSSLMTAPAPIHTSTSARGRAVVAVGRQGSGPSRSGPALPANYRPLDPAIDPDNDPRSKYGRISTRGGASTGRGGGNVGRSSARADFNARLYRSAQQKPVDMLADPSAFMLAVGAMNAAKTATSKTAPATTKVVKASPKTSSTTIESKWGDTVPANCPAAGKVSIPTTVPSSPAPITSNIRQVPTSEFAFPHPHRGDTDSWTDGVPSGRLSVMDSPSVTSQRAPQSTGPSPVGQDHAIGLGIDGIVTSVDENAMIDTANTADGINLMDVTEDLTALQEAPVPRAALARRIIVNGAVYTLDESALGNASVDELESTPAPPPAPTPLQAQWTSPAASVVQAEKPKNASTAPRSGSNIGDRHESATSGTQTTPSMIQSKWAKPVPSTLFRPRVDNPFGNVTGPTRAHTTQQQSPGEFAAFIRRRPEEVMPAFCYPELTSSEGVESVMSTPNLASLKWGRADAQVTTNASGQVQFSLASTVTPQAATPITQARLDRDVVMADATFTAPQAAHPPIIDNIDLVRLQAVGNAGFGMTPFRSEPLSSTSTTATPSRPTHTRLNSTAISTTSDTTISSALRRGLTASRYAPADVVSSIGGEYLGLGPLQSLSLNSLVRPREIDNVPKPPPRRSAFGTGSNVSRYAIRDENARPLQTLTATSSSGMRPTFRFAPASASASARVRPGVTEDGQKYKPISETRVPAGPGYALLQTGNAATAAQAAAQAATTTAPLASTQNAGLFSYSTPTTQSGPIVEDDGYESEL